MGLFSDTSGGGGYGGGVFNQIYKNPSSPQNQFQNLSAGMATGQGNLNQGGYSAGSGYNGGGGMMMNNSFGSGFSMPALPQGNLNQGTASGGQMGGGYGGNQYGSPPQFDPNASGQGQQGGGYGAPYGYGSQQTGAPTQAAGAQSSTGPWDDFMNWFSGGGKGGGQKTTQTTTVTPWGAQGDQLKNIYANAADIFAKQSKLGPPGFDAASTMALKRMQEIAQSPDASVNAANGAVTDIASGGNSIGTGGMFNAMYQQPGITNAGQYQELYGQPSIDNADQYKQLYNSGVSQDQFHNLYNDTATGQGNLDQGMYAKMSQGGMVDKNPFREQAIQQSMDDAMNQIKAQFTGAGPYTGRMGSSAYGDFAARQLGNIATNARMQGYNTDTANMMQAAQARDQSNLGRQGLALQAAQGQAGVQSGNIASHLAAAQGLSGVQGQNTAAQLAAAQGLSGIQGQNAQTQLAAAQGLTGVQGQNIQDRLAAAQQAPAISAARYSDAQQLAGVGAAREQMAQQQRNFGQQNLQNWSSIVGGVPGQAGQSQTQQPGQSWWQTLAGLGGIGLGLGGLFGGL